MRQGSSALLVVQKIVRPQHPTFPDDAGAKERIVDAGETPGAAR